MDTWQALLTVASGALIGYVTNWIAIRMLFRPLYEKRFFGFRVPFTPGVIPRGKERLGEGIGYAVGDLLLTGEKVAGYLLEPAMEERVREWLGRTIEGLWYSELTPAGLFGKWGVPPEKVEELAGRLAGEVRRLLEDDGFCRWLAGRVDSAVSDLLRRKVGDLVGSPAYVAAREEVGRVAGKLLAGERFRRELESLMASRIRDFLTTEEKLSSFLSPSLTGCLRRQLQVRGPDLVAALIEQLNNPRVRAALASSVESFFLQSRFKRIVGNIFEWFGADSGAIADRIVAEVIRFFDGPAGREEVSRWLLRAFDELMESRVCDLLHWFQVSGDEGEVEELARWFGERLARPERVEALLGAFDGWLEKNRRLTWGELFGNGKETAAGSFFYRLFPFLLDRLAGALRSCLDYLLSLEFRKMAAFLPDTGFLVECALRLYRAAVPEIVPPLVRAVDLKSLVRKRVDELDVLQVEEMLLGIVRRELTAITWLGALLGAVLGLATVGLRYLTAAP